MDAAQMDLPCPLVAVLLTSPGYFKMPSLRFLMLSCFTQRKYPRATKKVLDNWFCWTVCNNIYIFINFEITFKVVTQLLKSYKL